MRFNSLIRGAQQTSHRQPVAGQNARRTTEGQSGSPFPSVSGLLIQDLTWWEYLAPDECAETSLGRQQPIDQSHVGIELGPAGAWVGIREPHSRAFAKPQLVDVPDDLRRRQAHRLSAASIAAGMTRASAG